MARLIFLYVQHKASPGVKWNQKQKASNFYADRIQQEGYYHMVKRMQETKIVDELVIFVESGIGQGSMIYQPGITGWVMPDIDHLESHLRSDDIIFVRGGWKSWHDPLVALKEKGHKLLIYAANTARERWEFWDVVFNDLNPDNKVDRFGRLQRDFHKPTNPDLFRHVPGTKMKYDLCIGSSHIADKKGQWRTVEALLKYRDIFDENPMTIMPGSYRRGAKTLEMIKILKSQKLNVITPGMVDRKDLNKIYNQSKYFIHLGGGGQGDRGPIEAMTCGCNLILGNTRRHHKLLYENGYCDVFPEDATAEETARHLYYKIKIYDINDRKKITDYYENASGIETVILPEMKELFDNLRRE